MEASRYGTPQGASALARHIFAALTLIVANFVPLDAIATMGSTGFLFVILAVGVEVLYRKLSGRHIHMGRQ